MLYPLSLLTRILTHTLSAVTDTHTLRACHCQHLCLCTRRCLSVHRASSPACRLAWERPERLEGDQADFGGHDIKSKFYSLCPVGMYLRVLSRGQTGSHYIFKRSLGLLFHKLTVKGQARKHGQRETSREAGAVAHTIFLEGIIAEVQLKA